MNFTHRLIQLIGIALFICAIFVPEAAIPATLAVSGTFSPKFTFTDTEIRSFEELVYEDVFIKGPLTDFLTIREGIKAGKKIGIVGEMSAIGRTRTTCEPSETDVTIATIEKTWVPCQWGDRLPFCVDDLRDQFYVWGTHNGIKKADLGNTEYADFILDLTKDAMLESLYRLSWFGDTAADTFDNEPGLLTVGTDVELFRCTDGFWKQVFAIVAADSDRKSVTGLTAKNAEATYLDQEFTDQDTTDRIVTTALQKVINGSHLKARQRTDRIIVVTQSVADQYSIELESANGVEAAWLMLQNGVAILKRSNETIMVIPKLDDIIRTFFDNGSSYHLPHRILMFPKSNFVLGTEDEASLSELDMFFWKKDGKNYVDFGSDIDFKIIQDILVQAAY